MRLVRVQGFSYGRHHFFLFWRGILRLNTLKAASLAGFCDALNDFRGESGDSRYSETQRGAVPSISVFPQKVVTARRILSLGREYLSGPQLVFVPLSLRYRIPTPNRSRGEPNMNSAINTGVSRRSFMRILGAASAAATTFPAFAA